MPLSDESFLYNVTDSDGASYNVRLTSKQYELLVESEPDLKLTPLFTLP